MQTLLTQISALDIAIVLFSALLMIAAKPLVNWLNHNRLEHDYRILKIRLMRVLNGLVIVAIVIKTIVDSKFQDAWLSRIAQILITLYFAMLFVQILHFLIRQRFGKKRQMQETTLVADTYASRALALFGGLFVGVIALVACLQIAGLESWLETGGVLGVIGLFLALTQASWAPDLVSGLIILNSRLCEEGDVVQIHQDGQDIVASVFKTKFFHTEFLDLVNNHRLMIPNSRVRNCALHNLSRFASAKGLRECLTFNIGYEHTKDLVEAMFKRAFDKVDTLENLREEQFDFEIRVVETADYAVTWGVFYHIKDVKTLMTSRQVIRAYILEESIASEIALATPVLQQATIELKSAELLKTST